MVARQFPPRVIKPDGTDKPDFVFEEIGVAGKRLEQANQRLERELAELKDAEEGLRASEQRSASFDPYFCIRLVRVPGFTPRPSFAKRTHVFERSKFRPLRRNPAPGANGCKQVASALLIAWRSSCIRTRRA